MRCKQPYFNVQITVQRCENYSTVLFIIQCDTVIYTALRCKQITIVTVIFTIFYWRLGCQYSTVNFTIFFYSVGPLYIMTINNYIQNSIHKIHLHVHKTSIQTYTNTITTNYKIKLGIMGWGIESKLNRVKNILS